MNYEKVKIKITIYQEKLSHGKQVRMKSNTDIIVIKSEKEFEDS